MDKEPVVVPADFEREQWETEMELRRQELRLKEREQSRIAAEAERTRWWNPLFIAVLGATIAATGSIAVSWWNGKSTQQTEAFKAEAARILEMIKTDDVEKSKEKLRVPIERRPYFRTDGWKRANIPCRTATWPRARLTVFRAAGADWRRGLDHYGVHVPCWQ